ncbi:hypothetical protein K2X33_08870 [bacterium]|nr:hypothetical protein [bacterium]
MKAFYWLLGLAVLGLVAFFIFRNPAEETPAGETAAQAPLGAEPVQPATPPAAAAVPQERQASPAKAAAKTEAGNLAALKAALTKAPENPELLTKIGLAYAQGMNDPKAAMPYFERALKAEPGNGVMYHNLVGAYLAGEQTDRGVQFFNDFLASNPPNPGIAHSSMADLLAASGRTKEARGFAERAVRENPDSAANRALLANILLSAGDPGSENEFRMALDLIHGESAALIQQGMDPAKAQAQEQQLKRGLVESLIQGRRWGQAKQEIEQVADPAERQQLLQHLQESRRAPNAPGDTPVAPP